MGMHCFCAQAQNRLLKSEIYLVISSYILVLSCLTYI